jgi:predicted chitinase
MRAKDFINEIDRRGFLKGLAGAAAVAATGNALAKQKPKTPTPKPGEPGYVPPGYNPNKVGSGIYAVPDKDTKELPKHSEPVKKDTGQIKTLSDNPDKEIIVHREARNAGIRGVELAQFLGQTRHESADFSHMKEQGGSEYFIKKYDVRYAPHTAKILGNTHPGDGEKYHGRGFIQITGRDNYRMAGESLGLPLLDEPDLASRPDVAARIAIWYWKTRVRPQVTNFKDTPAVTKRINPAMKGLQDRIENFKDYMNNI